MKAVLTYDPQNAHPYEGQEQQLCVDPVRPVNNIHCLVEEGVAEEAALSPAMHILMRIHTFNQAIN